MKKSRLFLSIAVLILCAAAVWAEKTNRKFILPGTLYYSNGDTYTPFDPGRRAALFTSCASGQEPAKVCFGDTCYGVYTYEKGNGYVAVCATR
jgi:hypothetical protein